MARLQRIRHWSWRLGLAVCGGLTLAGGITAAFALTLHYVSPAGPEPAQTADERPIVEDGWIKVPSDITRVRECLTNSTITLRRKHDYGGMLGWREDIVVLGLYNTTISEVGTTHAMLWFSVPPNLSPGSWNYAVKAQDDCGGVGDLLNFSLHRPRLVQIANALIIPEGRP